MKLLILSIESDGLEQAYEGGRFEAGLPRLPTLSSQYGATCQSQSFVSLTYYLLVSFRLLRLLVHEILTLGLACETGGPEKTTKLEAIDYDQIAALYL